VLKVEAAEEPIPVPQRLAGICHEVLGNGLTSYSLNVNGGVVTSPQAGGSIY
jgi:hypothetical protein